MYMFTGDVNMVELLTKTLDTREAAVRLFSVLRENSRACADNSVELDFQGVEFMSRSFADQFHKERMKFQEESGCTVLLKNADYQVIDILEAVVKTQNNRNTIKQEIKILSYSDMNQMQDYIFAW